MVGAGAAVAVVAVAAVVVVMTSAPPAAVADPPTSAQPAPSSASAPVRAYITALIGGDASAAFAVAPAPDGVSKVLLAPEVYAAAIHPTSFTIGPESISEGTGTVTASIELAGRQNVVSFSVSRGDQTSRAVEGWTITEAPLASVAVGDATAVRTVNTVPVNLSDVAPGTSLPALIGTYVFDSPPTDGTWDYGASQTVDAGYGDSPATPVSFTPTLSASGAQAAVAAVESRVENCMLSDAFQPRECPNVLEMEDPRTYAVTALTRRWTRPPVYEVVTDGSSYAVAIHGGDVRIDFERRRTEAEPWVPDRLTQTAVFGSSTSSGTAVPFTVDSTGVAYDFSGF